MTTITSDVPDSGIRMCAFGLLYMWEKGEWILTGTCEVKE